MTETTRSVRSLSGDHPLTLVQKLAWLGGNALAAGLGDLSAAITGRPRVFASADLFPYPLDYEEPTRRATLGSSPARLLAVHVTRRFCSILNERMPGPFSVLDLGCGQGGFYPFFRNELRLFRNYTGVDVVEHPRWQEHMRTGGRSVAFVRAAAEDYVDSLSGNEAYNFVYSNSALEHMEGDRFVVEKLAAWAELQPRAVAQLHIVPATAALLLYRCHGYRVYSARDVHRLARLFSPAQTRVVGLGGVRSFVLQLVGLAERDTNPRRYGERLLRACAHDVARGRRFPIFWCLIVVPPSPGDGASGYAR